VIAMSFDPARFAERELKLRRQLAATAASSDQVTVRALCIDTLTLVTDLQVALTEQLVEALQDHERRLKVLESKS
jgi:hypothetical protein